MSATPPDQIEALRQRLEQRQQELRGDLQRVDQERDDMPGRTPREEVEDSAEQGEQISHEAVRDAEQERDVDELRDIAAALVRIEQGGYGVCIDCGVDIPLARLHAQPAAARCIDCQAAHERANGSLQRASPPPGTDLGG
jgi:DnaK suppressor protein